MTEKCTAVCFFFGAFPLISVWEMESGKLVRPEGTEDHSRSFQIWCTHVPTKFQPHDHVSQNMIPRLQVLGTEDPLVAEDQGASR